MCKKHRTHQVCRLARALCACRKTQRQIKPYVECEGGTLQEIQKIMRICLPRNTLVPRLWSCVAAAGSGEAREREENWSERGMRGQMNDSPCYTMYYSVDVCGVCERVPVCVCTQNMHTGYLHIAFRHTNAKRIFKARIHTHSHAHTLNACFQ